MERQRIVRLFDCPLREFDGKAMVSAHAGLSPSFGPATVQLAAARIAAVDAPEAPLYFVSDARLAPVLAADIVIVVQRMLYARETDGVLGANTIRFVGRGTQFKLHAYWYEPVGGDVIGQWRCTFVLRHLLDDDGGDSKDLEGPCYLAVDHCLGHPAPQDLRVSCRNEFGSEFPEIEGFGWRSPRCGIVRVERVVHSSRSVIAFSTACVRSRQSSFTSSSEM